MVQGQPKTVARALTIGAVIFVIGVTVVPLAFPLVENWLARQMFCSGGWLVEDANAISPNTQASFEVLLYYLPEEITGVYEYCEGWLFSETYLRFTVPDANEYEALKTEMLDDPLKPFTSAESHIPPVAKQVQSWWSPPGGLTHEVALRYFAFDDPNQTVYALACRD